MTTFYKLSLTDLGYKLFNEWQQQNHLFSKKNEEIISIYQMKMFRTNLTYDLRPSFCWKIEKKC